MVFANFTVKIIDVASGASSLTPSLTILTVNLVGGKRSTWDMGGDCIDDLVRLPSKMEKGDCIFHLTRLLNEMITSPGVY